MEIDIENVELKLRNLELEEKVMTNDAIKNDFKHNKVIQNEDLQCLKQERIRRGIECLMNVLKPYSNVSATNEIKIKYVKKLDEFVMALEV